MKKKLLVYIADDHNVVRNGMTRLLKTFNRIGEVGQAANGKELLGLIRKKKPDAVIMDVEMPVMGGIEATRYISDHFPEIKILILTMHTEEIFITKLIDLGAHAFLSKDAEPEEVESALYAIVDLDFYQNSMVKNAFVNVRREAQLEGARLTSREVEILILICQELTPGEISKRLKISEKTFFNHRANILVKTNARNNVGLLKYAYSRGLYK